MKEEILWRVKFRKNFLLRTRLELKPAESRCIWCTILDIWIYQMSYARYNISPTSSSLIGIEARFSASTCKINLLWKLFLKNYKSSKLSSSKNLMILFKVWSLRPFSSRKPLPKCLSLILATAKHSQRTCLLVFSSSKQSLQVSSVSL